ncbi:MAG: hypothetical protein Q8Q05_02270 [bacterium]|nr:hypothetical protein [bacterium]
MKFLATLWRRFSLRQRIVTLIALLIVVTVPLVLWGRAEFLASETPTDTSASYALNIIVREEVGNETLPAQGFVVFKPDCRNPKNPASTRIYLTEGRAYCTVQAGSDGLASVDYATFTSTRQEMFFQLPLSGEESLSKLWVSESLTIEATINSDGTVSLTTKSTQTIR